jgi:hypothetical protein
MDVYLINVHLTGVHLKGDLKGVHLIDVYFMDVYMFPNPKWSWRNLQLPTLQTMVDLSRSEFVEDKFCAAWVVEKRENR